MSALFWLKFSTLSCDKNLSGNFSAEIEFHEIGPSCFTAVLLQLYEEHAFLRSPPLISSLSHVLKSIDDISVPVDPALKTTLEQHAF
jgi:hypothetical protein